MGTGPGEDGSPGSPELVRSRYVMRADKPSKNYRRCSAVIQGREDVVGAKRLGR
jgi:hypothetical protein